MNKAKEYLTKLDIPFQIQVAPWNRIIRESQKRDNGLILKLIRNKNREDDFHWILPLIPAGNKMSIFAKKGSPQTNKSLVDLVSGQSKIICQTGSAQCLIFGTLGFQGEHLIKVDNAGAGTIETMVLRGRADLMIDYEATVLNNLKLLNEPSDALLPIVEIETQKVYIAVRKNFNPVLLDKLRKGIDQFWDANLK